MTGIVLGSAFSIAFGLGVVKLIFWVIGDENPAVFAESASLWHAIALFGLLTAVAGASFVALLKSHRLWWLGQLGMWLVVIGIGRFYWPSG